MNAPELITELESAQKSLKPCSCGWPLVMRYEPGCTWLHCLKESRDVLALPDWQPTELARLWNKNEK